MDRYYNDILVDKILNIMDRKDISKVALAEKLGMKPQTLGNYLLKHRAFPYEIAIKIIIELNIDIKKLYDLTEDNIDEDYIAYLKFKKVFEEILDK